MAFSLVHLNHSVLEEVIVTRRGPGGLCENWLVALLLSNINMLFSGLFVLFLLRCGRRRPVISSLKSHTRPLLSGRVSFSSKVVERGTPFLLPLKQTIWCRCGWQGVLEKRLGAIWLSWFALLGPIRNRHGTGSFLTIRGRLIPNACTVPSCIPRRF